MPGSLKQPRCTAVLIILHMLHSEALQCQPVEASRGALCQRGADPWLEQPRDMPCMNIHLKCTLPRVTVRHKPSDRGAWSQKKKRHRCSMCCCLAPQGHTRHRQYTGGVHKSSSMTRCTEDATHINTSLDNTPRTCKPLPHGHENIYQPTRSSLPIATRPR